MIEKTIITTVYEYNSVAELEKEDQELVKKAKEITHNSYAPYSHFHVGAALILENGKIITGTNQENAAYPSGLCAERVAIFWANSQYPDIAVKTIAIAVKTNTGFLKSPAPPCGSCRQVLLETETRFKTPIKIILAGNEKIQLIKNAKSLLPINFDENFLKKA
ncbi:MAG: cytidine deaminase [Bacteroidetes bacterium 4572_117]|nr:MAG: cytidine deaminase [Bacteroidetes bacterium 4572_117]